MPKTHIGIPLLGTNKEIKPDIQLCRFTIVTVK